MIETEWIGMKWIRMKQAEWKVVFIVFCIKQSHICDDDDEELEFTQCKSETVKVRSSQIKK